MVKYTSDTYKLERLSVDDQKCTVVTIWRYNIGGH
jgi:hypothetical protein